ncbi:MAG: hypothetical protein JEZ11_27225 [Desulfobacterales bacterium]|nr:hypothetical protein [Desulfobacterales bacterium]
MGTLLFRVGPFASYATVNVRQADLSALVTAELMERMAAVYRGENEKSVKWLTWIR